MAKSVFLGAENFKNRGLPAGYTELLCVKLSGTQHFNLGFKADQDTRFIVDARLTSAADSGGTAIFGTRTGAGNADFSVYYQPSRMFVGFANGYKYSDWPYQNKRLTIDTNKETTTITDGTHTLTITQTYGTFTTANNLYLGTCLNNGTPHTGASAFTGEIYAAYAYKAGTLIRDLVPCISPDGTIGLYDLVNGVLYTNIGTGTLTAGPAHSAAAAMEACAIDLGVSSVARDVTNGYIGVSGIARQFWGGATVPIGELGVGSTVFMNVNGISTEFLIVNQGLPSSAYDSSCNGTWLVTKDAYAKDMKWDSDNHDYANSNIHAYLNNTFIGLFDEEIRSIIKQVKIPYRKGAGSGKTVTGGANGLTAKAFLLSYAEMGYSGSAYAPVEGAALSYFNSDSKRIAYYNGSTILWSLRTPFTNTASVGVTIVCGVNHNGTFSTHGCYNTGYGTRPCILLPFDAGVDKNFKVAA